MTPYAIPADGWQTKCGWTPFAGLMAGGRVSRVVLRGEVAYEEGRVLAAPGSGRVLPNDGSRQGRIEQPALHEGKEIRTWKR